MNKMQYKMVFLVFCCMTSLLSSQEPGTFYSPQYLPYYAKPLRLITNTKCVWPIDVDQDGIDEVHRQYWENGQTGRIDLRRNATYQVLGDEEYYGEILPHYLKILHTPDGESRILMATRKSNELFLVVMTTALKEVSRHHLMTVSDNNGDATVDTVVELAAIADLNGDLFPEAIIWVNGGWDGEPRGVLAYDLKAKRQLWFVHTAAVPCDLLVHNIDGQAFPEILVGTYSPGNGLILNEKNDCCAYLFVINADGTMFRPAEILGSKYTHIDIAIKDLNGDNQPRLVVLMSNQQDKAHVATRIEVRTMPDFAVEKSVDFSECYQLTGILDTDKDGDNEIVLAGRGGIRLLDDDLTISLEKKSDNARGNVLVTDFNKDGYQEFIIEGTQNWVTHFYNHKLELICKIQYGGSVRIFQRGRSLPPIFALDRSATHHDALFIEICKSPMFSWLDKRSALWGSVVGLGLVVIGFLLYILLAPLGISFGLKSQLATLPWGIIVAYRNGKPGFINAQALKYMFNQYSEEDLRFIKKIRDPLLLQLPYKKPEKYMKKEILFTQFSQNDRLFQVTSIPVVRAFRWKGYIHLLNDGSIEGNKHKALLWSQMAQRLAHELKNPLSTVQLTLQRLQLAYQEDHVPNVDQYDSYMNSTLEELQRLRRVTDGFHKFTKINTPQMSALDTGRLAASVIDKLRKWLPETIVFEQSVDVTLPDLYADEDQLQSLFYNLFNNAVRAMDNSGKLEFRASHAQWIDVDSPTGHRDRLLFEVIDNGHGIPEPMLDEVQQPYVTLSEGGTGLGLTICKRIVEVHNGTMKIYSNEGIGTRITIELPAHVQQA